MPTYQYRCKECDHEFEVVQSFTDDPLESCPRCEGRLKKVYGNVGISFKGSGFYKTDSRGPKKPSDGASTSKKEPKSTSDSSDSPKKTDAPSGDKKASGSGSSSGSTDSSSPKN